MHEFYQKEKNSIYHIVSSMFDPNQTVQIVCHRVSVMVTGVNSSSRISVADVDSNSNISQVDHVSTINHNVSR
jgi:hypothetical protein